MDPDAPYSVAQGTLLTSAAAAFAASVYGTVKGYNIGPLAGATAVNSGIAGATFFSFREYAVSPLLLSTLSSGQFLRRMQDIEDKKGKKPARNEKLTWSEMRMYKLPDTAISGALTGGILNAWKRGPAGVVPGAVTATIICSLLQLGYNELGVMRVRYVSRKLQEAQGEQAPPPVLAPTQAVTLPPQPAKPMMQRIMEFMGMPEVSDEEYLRKLRHKREDILRRIAEIEAEQAQAKLDKEANHPSS